MKTTDETLRGYDEEKLAEFFKMVISPKEMAKLIRRANYILALNAMNEDENHSIRRYWVEDIFYNFNELAELLDPYIDED